MVNDYSSLEEIQEWFAQDKFATDACGCRVIEAWKGHSVCEFDITPTHMNAQGGIMGGAIFTLADFALAICCNVGEEPTVSINNSIEFMTAAKGTKLIAVGSCTKSGRTLGFYSVDITDDLGTPVARMNATCYRFHDSGK